MEPLSSTKSILNNLPSPRAFDHVRMFDLFTILALIIHLFWYGLIPQIGTTGPGASEVGMKFPGRLVAGARPVELETCINAHEYLTSTDQTCSQCTKGY